MKKVFWAFAVLLLSACGSSSKNESAAIPLSTDGSEPLYFEQWAINYNKAFYTQNSINKDAHIHAKKAWKLIRVKG
jgi:hypothetical protein